MARDDQLRWATLEQVTEAAQSFLDPVLVGGLQAIWIRRRGNGARVVDHAACARGADAFSAYAGKTKRLGSWLSGCQNVILIVSAERFAGP